MRAARLGGRPARGARPGTSGRRRAGPVAGSGCLAALARACRTGGHASAHRRAVLAVDGPAGNVVACRAPVGVRAWRDVLATGPGSGPACRVHPAVATDVPRPRRTLEVRSVAS